MGKVVSAADQTPIPCAAFHYMEFPQEIVTASMDGTFDFPRASWRSLTMADTHYKRRRSLDGENSTYT
jgi:hypothetical protein